MLVLTVVSLGSLGCAGDVTPPTGGTGTGGTSGGGPEAAYLPARIRRLTNAEYDASVAALLGTTQKLAATTFPPDARQANFTLNDAQRVDPVLAKQLDDAATTLAAEARANGTLSAQAPCTSPAGAGGEACARTFIQSFAKRAYRRAVTTDETDALFALYQAGANGGSYDEGIELTVRAALQSASFLYHTELGAPDAKPVAALVDLTPSELADSLSFLISAGPPDQALLDASAQLATPDGRELQARRLLQGASANERLVRVVREWLGIDGVSATAKDTTVYPGFAGFREAIDAESVNFVTEVIKSSRGSVTDLLGADWSVVDGNLASMFYGVTPGAGGAGAHTALGGRRGILNQGAFLSVFAHASESAPVMRGVAVLRRVACAIITSPTQLNINVTPPVPDPNKTTRDRYAIHSTDAQCKLCHGAIDAVGFSFERFDGMGQLRPLQNGVPTENGQTVDTATTISLGTDFDGTYPDSNALAAALAASPTVQSCVARQMFRAAAGRSDNSVTAVENSFIDQWSKLPADSQGRIVDTIITYVRSPIFAQRRTN